MKFSIFNFQFSIALVIFIAGLLYVLAPGPDSIEDFPPLPNSLKSDEPGDTIQNRNIVAYFSDYDRNGITNFYKESFQKMSLFGTTPPISLNYPPSVARQFVRDQQVSTFLEEYVYPLRGSVFVNGYEPLVENEIKKKEYNFVGDHIHIQGRYFVSKTTLRYYPADFFGKIVVYLGIWISILVLFELFRKVLTKNALA